MTDQAKIQLDNFEKSIKRLKEALSEDIAKNELFLDATIQRFEFTFENAWKSIKLCLRFKGIDCASPRECFQEAFKAGLIKDEGIFLDLLECRNLTSHTYKHKTAVEVYETVKRDFFVFQELLEELRK